MSTLKDHLEKMKFDVRIIDHNLRTGALNSSQIQTHLQQIPDVGGNAESISVFNDSDEKESLNGDGH